MSASNINIKGNKTRSSLINKKQNTWSCWIRIRQINSKLTKARIDLKFPIIQFFPEIKNNVDIRAKFYLISKISSRQMRVYIYLLSNKACIEWLLIKWKEKKRKSLRWAPLKVVGLSRVYGCRFLWKKQTIANLW